MWFLIIIVHFVGLAHAASSCPDVRLDKSILKSVPVLDQDGSGLCYAYTAATMIDAYRFSHGDSDVRFTTSPLALAVQTKGQSENGNGWAHEVLANAAKICNHQEVSKHFQSTDFWTENGRKFWSGRFTNFDYYCSEARAWVSNMIGSSNTRNMEAIGSLDLSDRAVTAKMAKICSSSESKPLKIPIRKAIEVRSIDGFPSRSVVADKIKSLLNGKNPQPVGINYCEDVLRDPKVAAVNDRGKKENCKNHHFSTIVGSQISEKGKCQFLIRNSYGTSCMPYKWPCERGQIWVDEDELSKNIEAMIWLE